MPKCESWNLEICHGLSRLTGGACLTVHPLLALLGGYVLLYEAGLRSCCVMFCVERVVCSVLCGRRFLGKFFIVRIQ